MQSISFNLPYAPNNPPPPAAKIEELHQAIKSNAPLESISPLLTKEMVNAYHGNFSAIHLAVGNVPLLELLLKMGARIDALTLDLKQSALHLAVEKKEKDSIKFLLGMKANPKLLSRSQHGSIINCAVHGGSAEIVQLLLSAGATLNTHNEKTNSPLAWGVLSGKEEMVKFLLPKCPHQINLKNGEGHTPVQLAFSLKFFSIAKMLVNAGALWVDLNSEGKNVLHMAAESGCLKTVEKVLEICKGIPINTLTNNWETPLFLAIKGGHGDVAQFLLGKKAHVEGIFTKETTAFLHFAPTLKIFKMLIEAKVDLNVKMEGRNVLHTSILKGRLEIARFLISENMVDIHEKGPDDETALHLAASNGYKGIVQLLLDKKADIEARTKSHLTPLFLTVKMISTTNSQSFVQIDLVEFLLEKGADPNQESGPENGTPLHAAANGGSIELIDLLLTKGAKIDAVKKGKNSASVLMEAARSGRTEVVKHLLERGAPANQACGPNEETALHFAAASNNVGMLKELVAKGGDLSCRTKQQMAPLHIACRYGNDSVVDYCLANGFSVMEPGQFGYTSLHFAAANGFSKMAQKLIEKGAEVHSVKNDKTPFLCAVDSFIESRKNKLSDPLAVHKETFRILLAKEANVLEILIKDFDAASDKKEATLKLLSSFEIIARDIKLLHDLSGDLASHKEDFIKAITPFLWSHFLTHSFWQSIRNLNLDSFTQPELTKLWRNLNNAKIIFPLIFSTSFAHEFINALINPIIEELMTVHHRKENEIMEKNLIELNRSFDERDISELLGSVGIYLKRGKKGELGRNGGDLRARGIDFTLINIGNSIPTNITSMMKAKLWNKAIEKLEEMKKFCDPSSLNNLQNLRIEIDFHLKSSLVQQQKNQKALLDKLSQFHQAYCLQILQPYLQNPDEGASPSKKQKVIEV